MPGYRTCVRVSGHNGSVISRRVVGIAAATILGAAVAGGLYYRLGGSAPDPVDIEGAVAANRETSAATSISGSIPPDMVDGAWELTSEPLPDDPRNGEGSFVGFRLDEQLYALGSKTTVGRTRDLDASITLADRQLTDAVVTVDVATLATGDPRRDLTMKTSLHVRDHPESTFQLSTPVEIPGEAYLGEPVQVEVDGNLTINGRTLIQTASIAGALDGDLMIVTGQTDIRLSDYGIEPASGGRVFSISDEATLEWQLILEPDR